MEHCSNFIFRLYLIFSTTYVCSTQFFANALFFSSQIPDLGICPKYKVLIISDMQVPKISQIICCNSHLMDSCEKRTRFFPDFIGCKDTHFSQMSQAFSYFSSFAKKIGRVTLSHFRQNPQNEAFSGISFFANDFAIMIVSISQRSQCYDLLNHGYFHRLLFLDGWNIFYPSITFYD